MEEPGPLLLNFRTMDRQIRRFCQGLSFVPIDEIVPLEIHADKRLTNFQIISQSQDIHQLLGRGGYPKNGYCQNICVDVTYHFMLHKEHTQN